MTFWQYLKRILGFVQPSKRFFRFDQELVQPLRVLAERERRSEEEVAADLLYLALAQRDAAEANLQRWEALSPRQQQVVALTCLGYTNRQIAARLRISPETVKTYLRNILLKYDLRSKADLRQALSDWDFSAWDVRPK